MAADTTGAAVSSDSANGLSEIKLAQ